MPSKKIPLWWGPPKKFADRLDERKIGWLELFYDLVYVAAISQLTHHLAAHATWNELSAFFMLFALVFWSWVNGSLYYDLHGSDGLRTRYFTLLQMLAVTAVSITIHDFFNGHHQSFAVAFSAVQLLITYLWWSVGYYDPSHKVLNRYYLFIYSSTFILFIISIFTSYETANILWVIALVLNLSPGILAARSTIRILAKRSDEVTASASIIERFGLFTIIVLGESIFGIVNGISAIHQRTGTIWFAFMLGIMITFLLWWIYFDMLSERRIKKGYWYNQLLIFLHLILMGTLGMAGACLSAMLADMELHHHNNSRQMFGIAVAGILSATTALSFIMQMEDAIDELLKNISGILILASIAILTLTVFSESLTTITYLLLFVIILAIPIVIAATKWVRRKLFFE